MPPFYFTSMASHPATYIFEKKSPAPVQAHITSKNNVEVNMGKITGATTG